MEITCTACGKEIAPLELYDGTWSCPHCRNLLIDQQSELKITAENDELFKQGELLYWQWLFNRDGRASISLVEKAISLCRLSARQGNPKAIARLGYYYDKDYIGGNFTEVMRVKLAYNYYSQVCYSGLSEVETESGVEKVNWHDVCKKTAQEMLFMLSHAPAEIQESKTYNAKANLERLRSELGEDVGFKGHFSGYYKLSNKERMFAMLLSCMHKQRAPLFGAFKLLVSDMKELYERAWPGDEEKIPSALDFIAKKVFISYVKASELTAASGRFNRLGTSSSFERMFEDLEESDMIWIFFFNNNGGHKYLGSKGKRKAVNNVLYADAAATDTLKRLLQFGKTSFHTFYDDDIYQYSRQKSLPDATRDLIEQVCTGGGSE